MIPGRGKPSSISGRDPSSAYHTISCKSSGFVRAPRMPPVVMTTFTLSVPGNLLSLPLSLTHLYSSTHPGTGVPIVLAGSKLTSDQVCRGFGQVPLPRKNASHPPSLTPPFRPLWILLALVVLGFLCSFSPLLLPMPVKIRMSV